MTYGRLNRRQLLRSLGVCATGGASGLATLLASKRGLAQSPKKPKFLIVIAGAGGASIVDSMMAIRHDECTDWQNINCFPNNEVKDIADSPLRAVDLSRDETGPIPFPLRTQQSAFVEKHKRDILVATLTGTSVNHVVAQRRPITGNEAWNGRTMMEAVANEYGAGFALPNVNMTGGGYIEHGTDRSLPASVFNEPVADPTVFPMAMHGHKGLKNLPSQGAIDKARALRDDKLDPQSIFRQTFRDSEKLALWERQRAGPSRVLEGQDLISKLMFLPDIPQIPLAEYGLSESADGQKVRDKFPNFLTDPLEAQAALAFLLIKNRVSVTVTISPSFAVLLNTREFPPSVINPPLAFDFSHNAHRGAQAIMWSRIFKMADGLIDLLKTEESEPGSGESLWDHSLIYFATDFGRDRRRQNGADDFGSAHNLNNGTVIISPRIKGNTVLGGINRQTAMTHGFDPLTGVADEGETMAERHIYAGILQALDVDTSGSGLPDMRAMRKSG